MAKDAQLIEQLRALLELHGRVKQPWSYEKLEKATIAALPRLLKLAERGLESADGDTEDESEQLADTADNADPTYPPLVL